LLHTTNYLLLLPKICSILEAGSRQKQKQIELDLKYYTIAEIKISIINNIVFSLKESI